MLSSRKTPPEGSSGDQGERNDLSLNDTIYFHMGTFVVPQAGTGLLIICNSSLLPDSGSIVLFLTGCAFIGLMLVLIVQEAIATGAKDAFVRIHDVYGGRPLALFGIGVSVSTICATLIGATVWGLVLPLCRGLALSNDQSVFAILFVSVALLCFGTAGVVRLIAAATKNK